MATEATKVTNDLKSNQTHWKMHFDYEYIGSHNLKEGEEVVVTIKKVLDEMVFDTQENSEKKKLVVHFEEQPDLKMILNVTNAKTLERLLKTPHIDKWKGRKIQLYAADIRAFGQDMKALRIRDFLPKQDDVVDTAATIAALKKCKTLADLQKVFTSIKDGAVKSHPDVVALKNELKEKLS
jgi:predicted DNA-binding antitoxin AbrB/MazE fold protein